MSEAAEARHVGITVAVINRVKTARGSNACVFADDHVVQDRIEVGEIASDTIDTDPAHEEVLPARHLALTEQQHAAHSRRSTHVQESLAHRDAGHWLSRAVGTVKRELVRGGPIEAVQVEDGGCMDPVRGDRYGAG